MFFRPKSPSAQSRRSYRPASPRSSETQPPAKKDAEFYQYAYSSGGKKSRCRVRLELKPQFPPKKNPAAVVWALRGRERRCTSLSAALNSSSNSALISSLDAGRTQRETQRHCRRLPRTGAQCEKRWARAHSSWTSKMPEIFSFKAENSANRTVRLRNGDPTFIKAHICNGMCHDAIKCHKLMQCLRD